jgi:hypothetical protein
MLKKYFMEAAVCILGNINLIKFLKIIKEYPQEILIKLAVVLKI